MLVASSAHAVRLIAPKAQRFHPTMDGLGALTVDTDQTLCTGQFNFGTIFSGAKKPLNLGDIYELRVQKVIVDELYTADLTLAYGITPDITLGLDVPIDYSRNNLDYAQYKLGNTEVRDDVFHVGDIRMNAKFRVIDGGTYGLALIPFVNFDTGDRDYLLSEGKFGFGMKLAGHLDVAKPLTLYANLGAEQIGEFVSPRNPNYYTPVDPVRRGGEVPPAVGQGQHRRRGERRDELGHAVRSDQHLSGRSPDRVPDRDRARVDTAGGRRRRLEQGDGRSPVEGNPRPRVQNIGSRRNTVDTKGREANPPGLFSYFFRATFRFFVTPAAFTALRYASPRASSISARRS